MRKSSGSDSKAFCANCGTLSQPTKMVSRLVQPLKAPASMLSML